MKLLRLTTTFAVALLVSCATLSADEIAGNIGFEDPMGAVNGDPSTELNWFGFTGPGATGVGQQSTDPRSGSQHAEIVIDNTGNSFVGIQQWIDAQEGEDYTFSFFAKTDGGAFDVGVEYRIEWIDNMGVEISRIQETTAFTTDYALYDVAGAAPTGAVQLRAVVALQSFQGGTDGVARIDDTSVQGPAAIPEPGTIAFLGLGALGLVTRRRR